MSSHIGGAYLSRNSSSYSFSISVRSPFHIARLILARRSPYGCVSKRFGAFSTVSQLLPEAPLCVRVNASAVAVSQTNVVS